MTVRLSYPKKPAVIFLIVFSFSKNKKPPFGFIYIKNEKSFLSVIYTTEKKVMSQLFLFYKNFFDFTDLLIQSLDFHGFQCNLS